MLKKSKSLQDFLRSDVVNIQQKFTNWNQTQWSIHRDPLQRYGKFAKIHAKFWKFSWIILQLDHSLRFERSWNMSIPMDPNKNKLSECPPGDYTNTSEGCLKEVCICSDSSEPFSIAIVSSSSLDSVGCDAWESPRIEKDENCFANLGICLMYFSRSASECRRVLLQSEKWLQFSKMCKGRSAPRALEKYKCLSFFFKVLSIIASSRGWGQRRADAAPARRAYSHVCEREGRARAGQGRGPRCASCSATTHHSFRGSFSAVSLSFNTDFLQENIH